MHTRPVQMTADQVSMFAIKQVVSVDALGYLHPYAAIDTTRWRILDIQGRTAVLVPA